MSETTLFGETDIITGDEADRLLMLEGTIERGLKTFVEVGTALLEIRDSRLYRTTHSTFEEYCQHRWGMYKRNANLFIAATKVVHNLKMGSNDPILPAMESHVRPLTKLEPDEQRAAWKRVLDTAPNGKVTAVHVQHVVDEYHPRPHVAHNSGNNEWYTPAEYIEHARSVLGTIDLDPASSDRANETIQAEAFFTVDQDGLAREWRGNVWMNPPYSRIIERFAEKLVFHHLRGDVPAAVVLVNNATETEWFRRIAQASKAICFPYSRVRFRSPSGTPGQPLQGQAILYMGEQIDKFIDEFTPVGLLVKVV